jgi:hypothetical protein
MPPAAAAPSQWCGSTRRHLFCGECLSAAMKVNKKCPKCRKGITPARVHRVFFE